MTTIEGTTGDGSPDKTWVRTAGLAIGALTLLYMMAVALLVMLSDVEISSDVRNMVIIVLAVGLALGFSFIGGHAAASGTLPLLARHPLKFSTGGGVAVFLIVFFTAQLAWPAVPPPPPPHETWHERQVIRLRQEIGRLRGEFEDAGGDSGASEAESANLARIRYDSERLANEMLDLNEAKMRQGYIINKCQYGSYGLGMAASLEDSALERLNLARKTRSAAKRALNLISQTDAGELRRFLVDDRAKGRLHYLVALGLAIELQIPDGSVQRADVLAAMDEIPATFRAESPLEWNKWFGGVKELARSEP